MGVSARNTGKWDRAREIGLTDGRRPQDLITRVKVVAMGLRSRKQ